MKILFIVLFIIIIICLLKSNKPVVTHTLEHNTNKKDAEKNEDKEPIQCKDIDSNIKCNINKIVQEELQKYSDNHPIERGPSGPPGDKGPIGPKGSDGGTFIAKGIFRNNASPQEYIDRMASIGETSKVFLNKTNSVLPSQMWTFGSDNKIKNFMGSNECISYTNDKVFMDNCNNAKQFIWRENDLTIRSKEDTNKCLGLDNSNTSVKNKKSEESSLRLVSLEDCKESDNANQKWFFN